MTAASNRRCCAARAQGGAKATASEPVRLTDGGVGKDDPSARVVPPLDLESAVVVLPVGDEVLEVLCLERGGEVAQEEDAGLVGSARGATEGCGAWGRAGCAALCDGGARARRNRGDADAELGERGDGGGRAVVA